MNKLLYIYRNNDTNYYEVGYIDEQDRVNAYPKTKVNIFSEEEFKEEFTGNPNCVNFNVDKESIKVIPGTVKVGDVGSDYLEKLIISTKKINHSFQRDILDILEYLRQLKLKIMVERNFQGKINVIKTNTETFQELVDDIPIASLENIKYSSTKLSISVTYKVKGIVTNEDGAQYIGERILNYNIIENSNIKQERLLIVGDNSIYEKLTKFLGSTPTIISKSNNNIIIEISLKDYPIFNKGKLMINKMYLDPYYVGQTVVTMNTLKANMKVYRKLKELLILELANEGTLLEEEDNIYSYKYYDNNEKMDKINFYIEKNKNINSFNKAIDNITGDAIKFDKVLLKALSLNDVDRKNYIQAIKNIFDLKGKKPYDVYMFNKMLTEVNDIRIINKKTYYSIINKLKAENNLYELTKSRLNILKAHILLNNIDLTTLYQGSKNTPYIAYLEMQNKLNIVIEKKLVDNKMEQFIREYGEVAFNE